MRGGIRMSNFPTITNNTMKISFLCVGKIAEQWLQDGIDDYTKRLKHYVPFTIDIIPTPKNAQKADVEKQKELEGEAILAKVASGDELYLLDASGQMYSSEELAIFLQKKMSSSAKNLVIVAGGAFGFSEKVYRRSKGLISFSKLTFTHQIIRLLLCEQVYRAFTILRGEGYHH